MDIRMPGMDGVETFLKIKEILPNCTVVMMTGYAVESLIERALSEGAKACLNKPVSIDEILEIVDAFMPELPIAHRIMVVDDDADLRTTLQEILIDKGAGSPRRRRRVPGDGICFRRQYRPDIHGHPHARHGWSGSFLEDQEDTA